jgi:hypothetical protein
LFTITTLRACRKKSVFLASAPPNFINPTNMPPTTPPLVFNHLPGQEIPTKHKEAIRQLYGFAKVPIEALIDQYKLGKSTITRILEYNMPERARITRTGRPQLLYDAQVDQIIEYLSKSWDYRVLDYGKLHDELELTCTVRCLEYRLKQRGYFRYIAC